MHLACKSRRDIITTLRIMPRILTNTRPAMTPEILWQPTEQLMQKSRMTHYLTWLREHRGLHFDDYESAWQWSTDHIDDFWDSLWAYFDILSDGTHTAVRTGEMPRVRWYEGRSINYAEHCFRQANEAHPALLYKTEDAPLRSRSWAELRRHTAALQAYLRAHSVAQGDRVCAFISNVPEATTAFLAAAASGVVWSSCSPDFGVSSVVDRFEQIAPKVLFATDGYRYGGKSYDRMPEIREICAAIPSIAQVVVVPFLEEQPDLSGLPSAVLYTDILTEYTDAELTFTRVPFNDPMWVLYSSGTTGIPKAITHSQGGVLLEHLKYVALHNDVKPGERFFWYTTTGWMMWNFLNASLLGGATAVLYDGSPGYPDLDAMWQLVEDADIQHFGTSAPFLVACMRQGLSPKQSHDFSRLRSIGSTGSPLPPEAFEWVYQNVKSDVWLCSMSGGTDVCSAFVGGCPIKPLYNGEIQCRALGVAMHAYDDHAQPQLDTMGEMVVTEAMPSMPIYFWGDDQYERYTDSYFEMYPGIWRHGDWIKITDRGTLVIYGRSDATLNRMGIRIGSSEIYRAVDKISAVADSVIVSLELEGGAHYMPLFVRMAKGCDLTDEIRRQIVHQLRADYTPRHVPDEIIEVPDIPYTISGKKLERPVKRILMGTDIDKAANRDSMRNPESLDYFVAFAQERRLK